MKRGAVLLALCCACAVSHGTDLIYGFDTNTLDGFWAPDAGLGSTIEQNFEAPQEGISCMRCSFAGAFAPSTICRKDNLQNDFSVSDYNLIVFGWRCTNAGYIVAAVRLVVDGNEQELGVISTSGKRDGLWHDQSFVLTNPLPPGALVDLRISLLNANEHGWFDIDNMRVGNTTNFDEVVAWSLDDAQASNNIQGWAGNNTRLSVNTTIQTQGTGCAECVFTRCSSGTGGQWYNLMNQSAVQSVSNVNWSSALKMKWWYRIPTDISAFQFQWNAVYGTNPAVQFNYTALVSDTWYQAAMDLPGKSGGKLLTGLSMNGYLGASDAWPATSNKVVYFDAISFVQEIPEPGVVRGMLAAVLLLGCGRAGRRG